jgi:AhpD family alkylhydroperoxidase
VQQRINHLKIATEPVKALYSIGSYLEKCGLEKSLIELVKIRVSQINRCAYCLDMHTQDARELGETEQRIYALSAWEETPFFSERERAGLAWTETVTHIGGGVSDEQFESAREQFSEKELTDLTWAVVAINSWNRLAISFRAVPGTYKPHHKAQMAAAYS